MKFNYHSEVNLIVTLARDSIILIFFLILTLNYTSLIKLLYYNMCS